MLTRGQIKLSATTMEALKGTDSLSPPRMNSNIHALDVDSFEMSPMLPKASKSPGTTNFASDMDYRTGVVAETTKTGSSSMPYATIPSLSDDEDDMTDISVQFSGRPASLDMSITSAQDKQQHHHHQNQHSSWSPDVMNIPPNSVYVCVKVNLGVEWDHSFIGFGQGQSRDDIKK
eukprot:m.213349 g.213349  ORF g.213349 m.213349 type:complete len:175 (+) comp16953_c0_seq6:161-685(+)